MNCVTFKKMKQRCWLLLPAIAMLALGAAGCTQQDQAGSSTTVTADGNTLSVPDSVKTEAFSYWGLGNSRPIVYEVSYPNRSGSDDEFEVRTDQGVSSIELESVGDDVATFIIRRTGGLSVLGDQTVEARPDGVFTVASSMSKLSEPTMELPARLEPGKSWSNEFELQLDAGTMNTESNEYRIVGKESVTVPLGTFEAVRVEQSSVVRTKMADGKESKSVVKGNIWYVRDVGIVKMETKIEQEGSPALTAGVQAIRYAEDDAG